MMPDKDTWKSMWSAVAVGAGGALVSHYLKARNMADTGADWPSDHPRFRLHEQRAIENAAILCHEANRGYCEAIGDTSQVPWADAPQWQRDSAIAGVKAIYEDPDTTPEDSHEGWMKKKIEDGWVRGDVKDAEKKTHPCMVPYDELPAEQRVKDVLFGVVARKALTHWGLHVVEWQAHDAGNDQIGSPLKSLGSRTIGAHLAFNRVTFIALETTRVLLQAVGYPVGSYEVYSRPGTNAMREIAASVACCINTKSAAGAYNAWRATQFPRLFANWEDAELIRVTWSVTYAITQAVLAIEGVEFYQYAKKSDVIGAEVVTKTWYRTKDADAVVAQEDEEPEVGSGG
jgi:hypothetical protein